MRNQPRILITGAHSLLGKYLGEELGEEYNLTTTTRIALDITNLQQVNSVVEKAHSDVLIHLAAISNIDFCEKNPQIARLVNVKGTENIIRSLKNTSTHLIFLSSCMVFDGRLAPYSESNHLQPLNVYGQTKLLAENLLQNSPLKTTIIRASTMFGYPPRGARDNDVTYYLRQKTSKKPLYLVKDRYFNPIYALRVAQMIKKIIQNQYTGIIHLAGKEKTTRYEFVKKLYKVFGVKNGAQLLAVKSDYFPHLAPRPLDSTLDTSRAEKLFGFVPQMIDEELEDLRASSLRGVPLGGTTKQS